MLSKAEMESEIDEGTGKLLSNGKSILGESLLVAGIHTILVTSVIPVGLKRIKSKQFQRGDVRSVLKVYNKIWESSAEIKKLVQYIFYLLIMTKQRPKYMTNVFQSNNNNI